VSGEGYRAKAIRKLNDGNSKMMEELKIGITGNIK
jgi:hypothetical protein